MTFPRLIRELRLQIKTPPWNLEGYTWDVLSWIRSYWIHKVVGTLKKVITLMHCWRLSMDQCEGETFPWSAALGGTLLLWGFFSFRNSNMFSLWKAKRHPTVSGRWKVRIILVKYHHIFSLAKAYLQGEGFTRGLFQLGKGHCFHCSHQRQGAISLEKCVKVIALRHRPTKGLRFNHEIIECSPSSTSYHHTNRAPI